MRQPRDGARADNDIIVDNNEAKPYKMIYIARYKRILKQFGTKRSQVQILSPRPKSGLKRLDFLCTLHKKSG